jgi:pimeloyl-ACP methyl ester carboxylesterase
MVASNEYREHLSEKTRKKLTKPLSMFYALRTMPLLQFDAVRCICESGICIGAYPILSRAPKGDGHAIMVIPGLGVNDLTTKMMRLYFERCGYEAFGWEQGINSRYDEDVIFELDRRLSDLFSRYGKISIIGQCFGGLYALKLAHAHPDMVRSVITLGTSTSDPLNADRLRWLYKLLNGQDQLNEFDDNMSVLSSDFPGALSIPTTSIYSKTDGVLDWKRSVFDEIGQSESIAIVSSHFGMGNNPLVLWVMADRLAQPEEVWEPFNPAGWEHLFYK